MARHARGATSDSLNLSVCDETCSVIRIKSLQRPTIKIPTETDGHRSCNECGGIFECDETIEEKHQSILNMSCIKTRKNNEFGKHSDVQCFLLEQNICGKQCASTNMC